MARWVSHAQTWSAVATADTTGIADTNFHLIQGGSGTQRSNILEVQVGGQASSSAISIMLLAGDSTVSTTSWSGANLVALDPATAALAAPPVTGTSTGGTQPQRSSTIQFLNLSFNLFGGVVRWVAAPGEEIGMLGASASRGEVSLSAFTGSGTGAVGSHIVFEPF